MNRQEQHRIFSEWSTAHRGIIFRIVRANAFNLSDQEDLYQEVLTQLYWSIPSYEARSKVSTWVYRVALYSAITWSRSEKKYRNQMQALETVEHDLSYEPIEYQSNTQRNQIDWLYREIQNLKPIDRSLTLLLLDGFSYEEMAEMLGISTSNVGVRIHRVKQRLSSSNQGE